MRSYSLVFTCALTVINAPLILGLDIDLSNSDSIKKTAQTVTQDLLGYYNGGKSRPIGVFDESNEDICWWESGAVWASMIEYWKYTGDSQYNSLIQQALLAQTGPDNDYMPPNQTKTEGNDDQSFWALAAMTAAELHFPSPSTANVTWLDLAKSVFDLQVARWDNRTCGGGLRWQIFTFNEGYDYKNAISTGTFFQLAARLARYTGNSTYSDWANTSYNWISSSSLITSDFKVYDGAQVENNCKNPDKLQWSYVAADILYGSAVMYNLTNGDSQWKNRTQSFLSAMSIFFNKNGIIYEIACEQQKTCNHDQYAFKGIALQWMGDTVQIAPFTSDTIIPYLKSSAQGAAASCKGGDSKHACGFDWTSSDYDRKTGFGPELNALNVFVANLAATSPGPSIEAAGSQNPSSPSSGSASPTPGTAKSPISTSSAGPSASSSAQSTSMAAAYLPLQTGLPALFLLVAMAFSLM